MVEAVLVAKERNAKHSQGSSLVGTTMTVAAVVTTMVTQAALITETATTSIRAVLTVAAASATTV